MPRRRRRPAPVKRFYQTADFADPKVYVGQELPRPAEKAHIGADGRVPDRVVWQYFYLQTFFASGTHYILCEDGNDAPDISVLGKFGYIYANGQALVVPRLKTNIQQGKPLVMLHNTGGVTQAFASLRAGMISSQPPPESKDLLDNWIELVSPQPWAQTFGLPEILMIKELHERAPMLLDDTVVTVDTLEDGTEKTLQVLMACFSAASSVPELGLGEAAKLCVLTAWKRHMTLVHNAEKFEATADKSQLLLYSMAIISTSSSVIYGQEAALGIGPPGSGSGEAASGAAAALPGGAGDLLGAVGGVEGAAALAGRRLMEGGCARRRRGWRRRRGCGDVCGMGHGGLLRPRALRGDLERRPAQPLAAWLLSDCPADLHRARQHGAQPAAPARSGRRARWRLCRSCARSTSSGCASTPTTSTSRSRPIQQRARSPTFRRRCERRWRVPPLSTHARRSIRRRSPLRCRKAARSR